MSVWLLLGGPWLLTALLTWQLPRLAERFHPYWQVPVGAALAVTVAASTWISLVAASTVLLTAPGVSNRVVGAVLAVSATIAALAAVRHAGKVWLSLRDGRTISGSVKDEMGVVIVADDHPDAFAVPGRAGGLIVVTTGLATALTADERRVVIDHERAHLRFHHYFFVQAVELAACLNPLLRPWTRLMRLAVERCADEYAARVARGSAVRAVARAALLCAHAQSAAGCRITGRPSDVRTRVLALAGAAPPRQRWLAVCGAGLVALLVGAQSALAADVAQDRVLPEPGEPLTTVIG